MTAPGHSTPDGRSPASRGIFVTVVFMSILIAVMGTIGIFNRLAAHQNAAANVYEDAVKQLQATLLGLGEMSLSHSAPASTEKAKKGLRRFSVLRRENDAIAVDTADVWSSVEGTIGALLNSPANTPFNETSLMRLAEITRSIGIMTEGMEISAQIERFKAASAQRRAQVVNIVAAILMLTGTAAFFITRDRMAASALQKVRASELQLRQITDAIPALIAYVDTERTFRFHNKAYEETMGLTSAQIQNRTMRQVFGDAVYEKLCPQVDAVLAGTSRHFEHTKFDAPGGPRDYLVHLFPRYRDDGRAQVVEGFYSLVTDVTELKNVDRMKSEFVSIVSHELRTPLTSIRGSLGLVAGGMTGALPDGAKKLVDIAMNNCERLVRLVNNILDTEKNQAGTMSFDTRVVEIAPLIARSIADNEGFAAQHGVKLVLHAGTQALHVNVDSDSVRQVVTNLLSNAVKFSPRGEPVHVTISRVDSSVRVEVRDRGPGIPEAFRSRIFQKFSQADSSDSRPKGGSGLGLNISQAIISRLGGTVGFTSTAGAGATFYFTLPTTQELLVA